MTTGTSAAAAPGGLAVQDLQIVRRQLGRKSLQPFEVELRCPSGYPMVIECQPVTQDETPAEESPAHPRSAVFTTLYWLTCPQMIRHLSRYESSGWIQRLEGMASQDPSVTETMRALHAEYAARRRRVLGDPGLARLKETRPTLAESLETTGIGGVADPAHVKCLHAHAAYHLVRGGHPLFAANPELMKDVTACRDCDRLKDS